MDHLALPKDPIRARPRVPLLCDESHSANVDFLAYPNYAGWPQALSLRGRSPFWTVEQHNPSDPKLLEVFLQSWLFFALLRSMFDPYELFDVGDYIEDDGAGKVVHTRHLPGRMHSWLDQLKEVNGEQKLETVVRIRSYLTYVQGALLALSFQPSPAFSRPLHQSLLAVSELVETTINTVFNESTVTVTATGVIGDDLLTADLLQNGWCPAEIAQTLSTPSRFSRNFYLQNLEKPSLGFDHTGCSRDGCANLQIDLQIYKPAHSRTDCECESRGPNLEQVERILRDGTFPVLKVVTTGMNGVELEVLPYQKGMAFVALSHVWVDGLGNPNAIELPCCQLLRLKHLVDRLQVQTFIQWADAAKETEIEVTESRTLYLWCDSLCCPVEASHTVEPLYYKQLALAQLKTVYASATHVLVLDRTLECYSFTAIGPLEAAVRILNCRWMFRLWTFQEAGLAERLVFSFADEIVDLREIWREIQHLSRTDLSRSVLAQLVNMRIANLRIWYRSATYDDTTRLNIQIALQEFSRRKVSVPADEALCLATLLRLDSGQIARCEAERKMDTLWRLLSESVQGIRQKFIFSNAPRLSTAGYRWAPRTLLTNMTMFDLAFGGRNDAKASLTMHGLQVATVAWRIRMVGPPQGIGKVTGLKSSDTAHRHIVYIADAQGRFFFIAARDIENSWITETASAEEDQGRMEIYSLLRQRERHWYVLFDDPDGKGTERGLLAYLHRHENGIPVLRSVLIVSVGRVTPLWTRIWQIGRFYGNAMRRAWFAKCLQLLTIYEQVLSSLFITLPHLAKQPQVIRGLALLKQYRHMLEKDLYSCVLKVLRHAAQTKHVMQAWTAVGKKEEEAMELNLWILIMFSGRYAVVREEFSGTQQWYVD